MDGKLDWMAAGMPIEGTSAGGLAGDIARDDVPTSRTGETLGEARVRIEAGEWDICVVTNDQDVVLGVLGEKELSEADHRHVGDVMRPGPSTFRPHVPIQAMAHHMMDHDLPRALITTSDGRLTGVLRKDDAVHIAHGGHSQHE